MKKPYIVEVSETTSGNSFTERFATLERAEKYAAFVNEHPSLTAIVRKA